MNDSISIKQAVELLEQDGLLVGYDCPPQLLEHRFSHLSYSSADVTPDTFFICKGAAFKEEYLRDAIAKGAGVYLAQSLYEGVDCPHILVSDIRKAMSLVSIAFLPKGIPELPRGRSDRNQGQDHHHLFYEKYSGRLLPPQSAAVCSTEERGAFHSGGGYRH